MALIYTCDRIGCEKKLSWGNHQRISIDSVVYDVCKAGCAAPAADIKKRLDELGKMHAETYKQEAQALKKEFLVGAGRTPE